MTNFEGPIPRLNVDTGSINLEATRVVTGEIKLRNKGGSTLEGRVVSRCPGLTFSPAKFEGNRQTISYSFDPKASGIQAGHSMRSMAYITTNGGEKAINISVKVIEVPIQTPDGYLIANIQDFYRYYLKNPNAARRIFRDNDFYRLLIAVKYPYKEVYEALYEDANRDRAIDNFFMLSGLAEKNNISLTPGQIVFTQKPYDTTTMESSIEAQCSNNSYVEAVAQAAPEWVNLPIGKLTAADFASEKLATINFSISPRKIHATYAQGQIQIGSQKVDITYRRLPAVTAKLKYSNLSYDDQGIIAIENNSGKALRIKVFSKESYIRFTAKGYLIEAYGEIPFEVSLSAFTRAQQFFLKQPYMHAEIEVEAESGVAFKKKLPLTVGRW
ncbi:MAG: DUF5717 family protein [Defluviitaleaceae bacterium]|nr:DUF5717 family protein [Defluviitaleaceae bacterium]